VSHGEGRASRLEAETWNGGVVLMLRVQVGGKADLFFAVSQRGQAVP
jgi:hypothetical protein